LAKPLHFHINALPTPLLPLQVKPLAIINSEFEEVLFLDADNIPMSNPAALFDSAEYQSTGALFWPDFWQTATENPIWSILNLSPSGFEQESGQLVINKKTSWMALHLAFFLAKDSTFQQLVNGDKEAFRLAFLATATPFFMVQTPVASAGTLTDGAFCGHTMVQHDVLGEALFLHHNSYKHGAAISWDVMKSVASFASR
jgi:alpha 1,2-mannosyltransferase